MLMVRRVRLIEIAAFAGIALPRIGDAHPGLTACGHTLSPVGGAVTVARRRDFAPDPSASLNK
jgi:hypothetical protein